MQRTLSSSLSICFQKYVDFNGRAPRAEYWYFILGVFLIGLGIGLVSGILDFVPGGRTLGHLILALFELGIFLPGLAVAVRRLHDTDKSGWWYLIALVPLIGGIVLLIFFCTKGSYGPNRFGPDPYGGGGWQ